MWRCHLAYQQSKVFYLQGNMLCFRLTVQFSNGNIKNAEQLDFTFYKNTDEEHPRKKSRRLLVRLDVFFLLKGNCSRHLHKHGLVVSLYIHYTTVIYSGNTMHILPVIYRLLKPTDYRMLQTILGQGR